MVRKGIPTITNKQRVFLEHYFVLWNATEAARRAGYAEPNTQGPRLLVNVGIKAAIQEHIDQIMPAGEVLTRLAEHARGTMEDVINPANATLDLAKTERAGKLHLIKKFSRTETDKSTHVSIELYDAQSALEKLGTYHGLFKQRIDHSGTIGTYDVDIGGERDSSSESE
jgi:phage terminase small subunit